VEQLAGLVAFSFVSSVTPGPNNILLWASGAEFGVRRTIRHIVGTSLGVGAMALAVAAGLGVLVANVPGVALTMKGVGSVYLLYLAWRIAGAGSLERGNVARPLGILPAASFQVINPKAWIFALGAITTFRPAGLPIATGSLVVAGTMMVVILPTAALWAGAGDALGRLIADARTRRVVSLVLAVIVAATVAYVWI